MTSNKPVFRIMRQGYDRFEVDQVMTEFAQEIKSLESQLDIYQKQLEALESQRDVIKKRYQQLVGEIAVRERAAEEMSRLALSEANSIIDNAKNNADMIVREAMSASRQVLVEIARISNESNSLRGELKVKIKNLEVAIDGLDLPSAPQTEWISDDQDTSNSDM